MNAQDSIAEGFAATAVSMFEVGESRQAASDKLVDMWDAFGQPEDLFRAAAEAVLLAPQPISESAEQIEKMRLIREKLGVQSAEEQLLAAMSARELLLELAQLHP